MSANDAVRAAAQRLVDEYDQELPDWWPDSMGDLRDALADDGGEG